MGKHTKQARWHDAIISYYKAQRVRYRHTFAPVLRVQAICAAVVLCVVLCIRFASPACFALLQGRYETLFEDNNQSSALLRFAQQAVSALAVQAQAVDAPAGYSLVEYQSEQAWVLPIETYEISSGYGWREDPFTGASAFHGGVDFASVEGQAVLVVQDGIVERNYLSDSYGNCIMIRHDDGSVTLYAHLQYAFARVGERICAGEQIGTVGQTGSATGAHLHFEVIVDNERQDPSAALGL